MSRPPGLYPIRGVMGVCHVLVDDAGAVLIDTGLIGEPLEIGWRLRRLGLRPDNVKAILLTHGHLDHVGNLAWAKAWTDARVYAHRLEQAHIDGTYPYVGITRWCDRLERAGRFLLRVGRPVPIDVPVADGDELPFWVGYAWSTSPATRLAIAAFTAHATTFCSAETCSQAIFLMCTLRPRSSTTRRG